MARGHVDRKEARRSAKEDQRQEKGLAQRVGRLEREVGQLTKTMPMPAEQAANMAAGREADVMWDLGRLGGRRITELAPDNARGAGSPLPYQRRSR